MTKILSDYEFTEKFGALFTVTGEEIGGYTDTISYKLANWDIAAAKAAALTGIPPQDLEDWGWDEHERLAALMTGDYIGLMTGDS